jgi:hypothetical protein
MCRPLPLDGACQDQGHWECPEEPPPPPPSPPTLVPPFAVPHAATNATLGGAQPTAGVEQGQPIPAHATLRPQGSTLPGASDPLVAGVVIVGICAVTALLVVRWLELRRKRVVRQALHNTAGVLESGPNNVSDNHTARPLRLGIFSNLAQMLLSVPTRGTGRYQKHMLEDGGDDDEEDAPSSLVSCTSTSSRGGTRPPKLANRHAKSTAASRNDGIGMLPSLDDHEAGGTRARDPQKATDGLAIDSRNPTDGQATEAQQQKKKREKSKKKKRECSEANNSLKNVEVTQEANDAARRVASISIGKEHHKVWEIEMD